MIRVTCWCLIVIGMPVCVDAQSRIWTDASKSFQFSADLIGYNDDHVVLQRVNKELIMLPVEQLSEDDRKFLQSKEAAEFTSRRGDELQTWTLHSGLKVNGRVVDFSQREYKLEKRRGHLYLDDRQFSNVPPIQQQIVLRVVAEQEKTSFADAAALEAWYDGKARTYRIEGVVFELENGDEFAVPFFIFNDADRAMLEAGYQRWQKAQSESNEEAVSKATAEREALALQAQADAYQRDQEANQQLKMLELSLLATAAGVTDYWEIQIIPNIGVNDYARTVIVPGRNSEAARQAVAAQYPNYRIGAIAKINNRWGRW